MVQYNNAVRGMIARGRMDVLAGEALESDVPDTIGRLLGRLMKEAESHAVDVEFIEGTSEPSEIVRSVIRFSSEDDRLFCEGPPAVEADDSYSARMEIRRQRLPHVLEVLDTLVHSRGEY